MTIHDDLREVMGLLGKATGGKWYAVRVEQETPAMPPTHAVTIGPSWIGLDKGRALDADDAEAMVAAVTFLRQHGPALLAATQYEEANPLGGPATMLEAAARRVRAGEDFHEVLADYALLARQEGEDAAKWITAWRNRFIDEKTHRLQAGASMYYEEARAHAEESANQFETAFAEELRKRADAARSGGGGEHGR